MMHLVVNIRYFFLINSQIHSCSYCSNAPLGRSMVQLILRKKKNPYCHVVERCGSFILASRLCFPYGPMSLANTGGNSDESAYPIHEDIDRKMFLLVFMCTNIPGVWLWCC